MDTTLLLTMLGVGMIVRLCAGMAAGLTPALLARRVTPAPGGRW